jgi:hypothetical protein
LVPSQRTIPKELVPARHEITMAYAPSWRVVMNEDVMAKLDVLNGRAA